MTRTMSRGTPQDGAIFPVRRQQRGESGGVFRPNSDIGVRNISAHHKRRKEVWLWVAKTGLRINQLKTKMMLFTTRTRVPEFHLSS